jgi:PAS domain S-box-containing protein
MGHASGGVKKPKAQHPSQTRVPSKPQILGRGKLAIAADILESIDDYVSAFDRNWNFIYLSESTANLLGYNRKELLGKNFWETFPKFLGTSVEKNYRETMEKRVIRRFEWETIYAKTGFREFTVFPSIEGITVYGVDITERKMLQLKLEEYTKNLEKTVAERTKKIRESEQSYRELYESFGEAFIATDWELNIIHWNSAAERVTTIPAKEALGKKIYNVLPEMTSVDVAPYFEALQKKKTARFMMNTISRQTGRAAIFEVSTYPSNLGIIIIVEDKTVEEETKRLLTIGQTAGMVGHDIRNPLQAITNDLYLIREELKDAPKCEQMQGIHESLKTIEENVVYIDKIVSDLQDYTRPLAPQNREVNLKELLARALKTTNLPPNIDVQVVAAQNLVVKTDPSYLLRALSNLVINAVQALPGGGELTLSAAEKNGKVQISVKDTGVGISKETGERIFTPLFTTKAKGQGLGLAVVKRLVEGLGGSISYESQEGRGTEFFIELPLN